MTSQFITLQKHPKNAFFVGKELPWASDSSFQKKQHLTGCWFCAIKTTLNFADIEKIIVFALFYKLRWSSKGINHKKYNSFMCGYRGNYLKMHMLEIISMICLSRNLIRKNHLIEYGSSLYFVFDNTFPTIRLSATFLWTTKFYRPLTLTD